MVKMNLNLTKDGRQIFLLYRNAWSLEFFFIQKRSYKGKYIKTLPTMSSISYLSCFSFFQSSEMWATGLKSVTMTIRADKFCFIDNFYVSVVVLPDDDECHRHKKFADECILNGKNLHKRYIMSHTACIGFQTAKKPAASNLAFQAFERFIGT